MVHHLKIELHIPYKTISKQVIYSVCSVIDIETLSRGKATLNDKENNTNEATRDFRSDRFYAILFYLVMIVKWFFLNWDCFEVRSLWDKLQCNDHLITGMIRHYSTGIIMILTLSWMISWWFLSCTRNFSSWKSDTSACVRKIKH